MNENQPAEETSAAANAERHSALFANLIMQQANMAMMLMGQMPQPEGGESIKDLEAARLFIDQLEMLEAKTKGNLTKEESGLLKQTLMNLRLGFVQAVEAPAGSEKPKEQQSPHPQPAAESKPEPASAPANPSEDEQKKRFSKKY